MSSAPITVNRSRQIRRPLTLIEAKYNRDQVQPLYRGNPLIEALPAAPEMRTLVQRLQCLPPHDRENDPQQSAPNRLEMLETLKFFFQPLPRHFDLTQVMFSMIRSGYVGRCPWWGKPAFRIPDPAMQSAALIGPSGIGKSLSLRQELGLIDQVILHTEYSGSVVSETQVSWLRVECPHDASPRGLCSAILEKLGVVLGTDYAEEFGSERSTTNRMIPGVATLASLHHLGLLVIDEIQNLLNRRKGGGQELIDFIVRIINDFGVPVLMVGTSEAGDFLTKAFRVTRRISGLPVWGRLVKDDREWTIFTDALWKYQYVRCFTPLTADLRHVLYDLTQGIPDLAVKLYYLAQRHAINERVEQITPALLQKVNEKSLVQNRKYVNDLRNGKTPKEDYFYEAIFSEDRAFAPRPEQVMSGAQQARSKKECQAKDRKGRKAATALAAIFGTELADGASTYDAAMAADLVHVPEAMK